MARRMTNGYNNNQKSYGKGNYNRGKQNNFKKREVPDVVGVNECYFQGVLSRTETRRTSNQSLLWSGMIEVPNESHTASTSLFIKAFGEVAEELQDNYDDGDTVHVRATFKWYRGEKGASPQFIVEEILEAIDE